MNLWQDKLDYSQAQIDSDIRKIKSYFPQCSEVIKTNLEIDRQGVDYIATLQSGVQIFIDVKTRLKGASRYWKHGEAELALEVFSVVETKKVGWTWNINSKTHYILYTFDISDCKNFYFVPFQLLRKAFWGNGRNWQAEYGVKIQESDSWHSSAVFVPASVVLQAIVNTMCGLT